MAAHLVQLRSIQPVHLGSIITPDVLGSIARGLVLRGQVVGVVEDGGLVLDQRCRSHRGAAAVHLAIQGHAGRAYTLADVDAWV